MDFLKSAVASAISKGPPFPYSFGDKVDVSQSLWTLHNGTKREDGSNCSIFSFDVVANKARLPLARNAVRKLRTLRHPGVIKVLDSVETDTYIYIATERITPLEWHVRRKSLSTEMIKWGLYGIAKVVKFINDEASSIHGNIRLSSIYTSESGEWKLGGLDILSSVKDDEAIVYTFASLMPDSGRYAPPEVAKSGWETVKRNPVYAVDAYNFGMLIVEVFNGNLRSSDQIGQTTNIPPNMQQSYKRLLNLNPKARLSVAHFLQQGCRHGGFFETRLIRLTEDIESLGLKSEEEREQFLSQLDEVSGDIPEEFLRVKILPELLKSVEFGGGGAQVLNVVLKLGSRLPDDDYDSRITPVVVRLFASPDRAMRVCLLDNLPLMIAHLPQKIVNDKIFPQMVTGFTDLAPVVREQTVKAVLTIITRLSDRTINGELLRYLAKTANDEQPGIRTNTTICLGKIARNLGSSTRTKVLTAAFARSLRDPFVHARNASLLALGATLEFFSEDDCASKILPAICPALIDKEKLIRDQANKTLNLYLERVRTYGASLPDTILPVKSAADVAAGAAPRMGTPQNDSSWAGWAISSFTNRVNTASGDIESSTNGASSQPQQAARSASVPPSSDTARPASTTRTSKLSHQITSPSPSSSSLNSPRPFSPDAFADTQITDQDVEAWGDMDDGDDAFFTTSSQAQSENSKFPPLSPAPATAAAAAAPSAPSVPYDDGGEPDFAGWLTAQSQAKSRHPLPKGLTKSSNSTTNGRPSAGRVSTTGSLGSGATAKKLASTAPVVKPRTVVPKKIDTKPKEEGWGEEDDAWGEGWE
ncbi:MAG: hypothetical protein M1819_007058 [Sarea resinae]|nr:MAG: hypothetical protein M1819_007058 [Sarea resinae]